MRRGRGEGSCKGKKREVAAGEGDARFVLIRSNTPSLTLQYNNNTCLVKIDRSLSFDVYPRPRTVAEKRTKTCVNGDHGLVQQISSGVCHGLDGSWDRQMGESDRRRVCVRALRS